MDKIPLIPKSSNVASIDVAPVIGDVFQYVNEPTFEINVAQNVDKQFVENQNLKTSSAKVIGIFNDAKLSMEGIGLVESSLMVRHGACMNEKFYLNQDKVACEHLKLKRKELFLDLCQGEVDQYGLLVKNDILPIKPEKSMDFRLNSNRHLCEICPSNTESLSRPLQNSKPKTKVSLIPIRLSRKIPLIKAVVVPKVEAFRAEPKEIFFSNFELDITYEKTFKLRNISRKNQTFQPSLLSKNSDFKVAMNQNSSTRLAPGMCAIFTVTFKTDIFENRKETITFRSQSASETTVNIICFRKAPNLKVYVYKDLCHFIEKLDAISMSSFKMERCFALNSTIDCGSCFIGDTQTVTLVLYNDGSTGKFFFLPEEDWYTETVQSISVEMKVELPHFTLFPSFFCIEEDNFIEVILKFFPTKFGLEVEKIFFLCDNNAFQDIEIIGDGVLFENNTVVFQTDLISGDEKPNDSQIYGEIDEKIIVKSPMYHTLDFGECLAEVYKTRYITVHNNGAVDLHYKWVIKNPKPNTKGPKIKPMDSDMIRIGNVTDYLPGNSTTEFLITLFTKTNKLGHFGLVLIFYVLDIPKVALVDDVSFWVSEESQSLSSAGKDNEPKRLNLVVAEVELLCKMAELNIYFNPSNSIESVRLLPKSTFQKEIQITSNWNIPLECVWQSPRKYEISIEPVTFILPPKSTFCCNLSVYLRNRKTIRDTLKLIINEGTHKISYKVKIKISKAMAKFSQRVINFGHLYRKNDVLGQEIYIKNTGYDKLKWQIFEFYYNPNDKLFYEFDTSRHLSVWKGLLAREEQFSITYTTEIILEQRSWLSCLVLISEMPTAVALDTCLVMYQLSEPILTIKTDNFPIICPEKIMYLKVPERFDVSLYNEHKWLAGAFLWRNPMGKQSSKLQVEYKPRGGLVLSNTSVPITLTITPLETGIIDDIVLPCYVENASNPLLLTIKCAVDNIKLNIFLPVADEFLKVSWPLEIISSFSLLDFGGREEEEETLNIEENQDSSEEENLESMDINGSTLLCPSMVSIVNYTTEGMQENCEEEYLGSFTDDWKNLLSFKESKSLTLPQLPFTQLKNAFGADVCLHDYVIEFRQIPLKTPVKKSMVIENITPMLGLFCIECSNFYGKDEYEDYKSSTNLVYKLNIKRKDTWEEIIDGELGLVVKFSPLNGELKNHQSIDIDIWVYANTWGTYMEEVRIEVNDILPFCFNILVEVVGTPIEFPIACNTIRSSPVLRFGNIPYLSDPIARKLIIKNTSSIPINLVWHVFLCKPKSPKMRDASKTPFNVVLDTVENPASPFSVDSHGTDFKLMVTPVNYGIEDDEIFQVSPRDLRINPKSSEILTVIVNPQFFQPQYDQTFVEARLIAHLHLIKKHSFQSNLFSRLSGTEIPPAKVKLLATIELPLLKLELVKGETRIRAYANDIIDAQEIIFERILVFKNCNTAPIVVYMHTSNPFKVIYLHTKTNPKKAMETAEILPQECVEALIRCTMDGEAVFQYSNMLYNEKETIYTEIPNFSQQSLTLVRSLNIHQYGLQQQITNLEMILFYPKLIVSDDFIDFGVVFVGKTKKSFFTLTNPTGSHVPFNIQSNAGHFLTIIPSNGSVPKAIGIAPSSVIVSLYFMPKECQVFQDTLRVITNMPLYYFQVNVMGTGSNNEKFLNEGI